MNGTWFGKYRGTVTDNNDPDKRGRIKARVPDVMGDQESGWALACVPFAGPALGFFAVPAVGTGVWVEFEHGDPDYPVWSGCWWGAQSDVPTEVDPSTASNTVVLKTEAGHMLVFDANQGITIQASGGQKIVLSSSGIEIDNGSGAKVSLSGTTVSVNDGALEVT